ncbi:MAG TPA: AraC family transcriptional regulator [Candidatus Enterococcus avicola]|uniref:AraC family transcriptional regulator n=1 Tax=Candidatus Enterococcus avicola TaxID=2838561 RepID=A0A9D2F8I2_9ENTE|nr:AraC family transcriptional regulator [Candidatus Enterococcus avicola]
MKKKTLSIKNLRFEFKSKTFYRYVFSYLLVFLIPFLFVSFVWYQTSTSSINQQIDLSAKNQLLQARTTLRDNFSQFDLITTQMRYNSLLTEKMATHPYYSSQTTKEIQAYKINSSVIEDMYLHFNDAPDKLFSSKGYLDVSTFIERRYDNFLIDEQALRGALATTVPVIQSVQQLDKDNALGLMFYIVPLTTEEGVIYGSVVYTMKMSDIQRWLDQKTAKVFLLDAKNRLVAASTEEKMPAFMNHPAELKQVLSQETVRSGKDKYRVSVVRDEDFDLTYLALTNSNSALSDVKAVQQGLLGIVLILLASGIAIVFFIGKRQYKPIQELEKLMEQQIGNATSDEESYDIHNIGSQVANFLQENKELHQEIRRQTPHAREQVLRKLLMGRFKDSKEISVLMQAVDVNLYKAGYFVMLVDTRMVTTETSIQNQEFLMSFLDEISGVDYQAYGSEMLSTQAIALLVSFEKGGQPSLIAKEIVAKIVLENVVAPAVGIGGIVHELSMINHSYIEGLAALEYQTLSGSSHKILLYKDIKHSNKNDFGGYPVDEQLKLRQSLQQGDLEIATETINEMVEKGVHEQQTLAGLKLYSYYLLNSISTTGIEIIGKNFYQEAEKIADFSNIFELQKGLLKMSEQICQAVQDNPKNEESQLQKDIFTYLNTHYASRDFSLESVAEEFEVSVSYLSRFIKKESGVTFSKYIQNLRLEKIKSDLVETDTPIKDIIAAAGYYDVSNYTRKFKSIVGMTPGQYREKNR